ncbi:MAG: GAF domain-containing protein, partial [Bacteroidota bacterium]
MRKIFHSITGKLILISAGLIIFWIIAVFLVADRISISKKFSAFRLLIKDNISLSVELEKISGIIIQEAYLGGNPLNTKHHNDPEQQCMAISAGINSLESNRHIAENIEFSRRIRMIKESCNELKRVETEYTSLLTEKGDINSGLILRINSLMDKFSDVDSGPSHEFIPGLKEQFISYLIENDPGIIERMVNDIEFNVPETGGSLNTNALGPDSTPQGLLQQLIQNLRRLVRIDQKLGFRNNSALSNELLLFSRQLNEQLTALERGIADYSDDYLNSSLNRLYLILIISGLIIAALIIIFSSGLLRSFDRITHPLEELSAGKIPEPAEESGDTETNRLAAYLNRIAANLELKTSYAESLVENGENKPDVSFSHEDKLGTYLVLMNEKLARIEENNKIRIEEERKRNWQNEGIAQFGEILRTETEDISELSFRIIKKLVYYLEASHGLLFIINTEDNEDKFYELAAAFAYDRRKFLNKQIRPGEGLTGTCALEKQSIYLTDIPEGYLEVTTGLGESRPASLLIVPLIYEEESMGIMEIASMRTLHEHEINFTEHVAENIAASLSAARNNIKTIRLLQQSREEAEEMAKQNENLRKKIEEIQLAQKESQRKEFEISGILNAINNSSMVAEYSLNGRIAKINEKFSRMLEMSPDQIHGKHHSEFSTSDRHSEDYKQFWNDLRNGNTKFLIEKFSLFNAKEIWLRQSYTPIKNDAGKILKILNIAYDITETRTQEQSLMEKAAEITRKNIEMQSLS